MESINVGHVPSRQCAGNLSVRMVMCTRCWLSESVFLTPAKLYPKIGANLTANKRAKIIAPTSNPVASPEQLPSRGITKTTTITTRLPDRSAWHLPIDYPNHRYHHLWAPFLTQRPSTHSTATAPRLQPQSQTQP